MGRLADHQHDLMRAKSLPDVFDRREDKQLLIGVALLPDARERRSGGIETLPEICLDFLTPRILKHDLGAITDRGSHVLDVAVVPSAVGPPMQVPASLFEPG